VVERLGRKSIVSAGRVSVNCSTRCVRIRDVHLECQSIYSRVPFCRSPHCYTRLVSRSKDWFTNGSPQLFSPLVSCATLLKVWHSTHGSPLRQKSSNLTPNQSRAQCCTIPFHKLPTELLVAVFQAGERSSRECTDIHPVPVLVSHICRLWRQVALDTALCG